MINECGKILNTTKQNMQSTRVATNSYQATKFPVTHTKRFYHLSSAQARFIRLSISALRQHSSHGGECGLEPSVRHVVPHVHQKLSVVLEPTPSHGRVLLSMSSSMCFARVSLRSHARRRLRPAPAPRWGGPASAGRSIPFDQDVIYCA